MKPLVRPSLRLCFLILGLVLTAFAQNRMTVDQLTRFIKSSVELKSDDRTVADFVKKITLTNRLEARTVEGLQTLGAGRLTVAALRALMTESASLPAAPAPVVRPTVAPAPSLAAPSEEEQKRILGEITEYALNYSSGLPNFVCLQVTKRYVDPSSTESFRLTDTIAERLSYFEHKEDYKVISVNGTPVTNRKHEQLGGAISSGEFGSMLAEIFDPTSRTEFHWERWGKWAGHVAHVFSFRVEQPNSKYNITAEDIKRTITVGYHGLIYADRDTNAVIRITMDADDIPSDFPIRSAGESLEYDSVTISGNKFILPTKVDMRMRDGKVLMKNLAEFRLYNKFGADTSIQFDVPDAAADNPPAGDPPKDKSNP
jgi:hypothetical protein